MKKPIVYALRAGGVFFLASFLLPLVFYGIFNTGTAAMLLIGAFLVCLPAAWKTILKSTPRLRRVIAALGCAGLVYCLVISGLMARRAWFNPPPDTGNMAVVVLGGKVNGDKPSLMLWRRLYVAALYLEQNPEAICVVSGGQGDDEEFPEALVMKATLVEEMGVDESRVLMEDASTNTRQNMSFSKMVLERDGRWNGERIVIATDSFHQLRASVFASAEGLQSYNLASLTPWGLMPSYWMREILAVSWAWVSIRL